jgi:hypothetical protein
MQVLRRPLAFAHLSGGGGGGEWGTGGPPGLTNAWYPSADAHAFGSQAARRQHFPGVDDDAAVLITMQWHVGVASQNASHSGMVLVVKFLVSMTTAPCPISQFVSG